jgi:GTPase SAR1 family protein
MRREVLLSDRIVELELWDTADQETYRSYNQMDYRNTKVTLVCFDALHFTEISTWIDELHAIEPACKVVFVLTKEDLMSSADVQTILNQIAGQKFFVTSALHDSGMKERVGGVAELARETPESVQEAEVYMSQATQLRCRC